MAGGFRIHNPSPGDYRIQTCVALAATGGAMFVGQAVQILGDSNAQMSTGGGKYSAGTLPNIGVVTDGDGNVPVYGVIVGFDVPNDGSVIMHRVASTLRVVHVLVPKHNGIIFELEDDSSGTPATTMPGANANFVNNATGSTVTGLSDVQLDATTPSADASNQLKIVGVRAGFANNAEDAVADGTVWLVQFQALQEANLVIGV